MCVRVCVRTPTLTPTRSLSSLTALDLTHTFTDHGLKLFRLLPHTVAALSTSISSLCNLQYERATALRSLCICVQPFEVGPLPVLHSTLTRLCFLTCERARGGQRWPQTTSPHDGLRNCALQMLTAAETRYNTLAFLQRVTLAVHGDLGDVCDLDLSRIRALLPPHTRLNLAATVWSHYTRPVRWPQALAHVTHASLYLSLADERDGMGDPAVNLTLLRILISFLASIPDQCPLRSICFVLTLHNGPAVPLSEPVAESPIPRVCTARTCRRTRRRRRRRTRTRTRRRRRRRRLRRRRKRIRTPHARRRRRRRTRTRRQTQPCTCSAHHLQLNELLLAVRSRGYLIRLRVALSDRIGIYDRLLEGDEGVGYADLTYPIRADLCPLAEPPPEPEPLTDSSSSDSESASG